MNYGNFESNLLPKDDGKQNSFQIHTEISISKSN